MKPHGPWRIVSSRTVYRDPWLSLVRDEVVRPDGRPGSYSVARLKPGVSVLALDAAGVCHLTEEFHYGVGRVTLETVSGGIDGGETPAECAGRELREELGIVAGRWDDLGPLDPFTGSVVSPTRLYLARDLTFGPPAPEGSERIRRVAMPLADAVAAVDDGRITHAPSVVLLLKTARLAR